MNMIYYLRGISKMIYYKIMYYNEDFCFGGQFLEAWQLKYVKNIVDFYFEAFDYKVINIRFQTMYTIE